MILRDINNLSGLSILQFGRSKKKVAPRSVSAASVGRLRIRWGRSRADSGLSHLDNIRELESAIKRSGIPAAMTQGVNPRLKLSFSPPLPMGFTSAAEFVDITLEQPVNTDMINKIRQEFTAGMELLEAKTIFSRAGSLSEQINRVEYTLELNDALAAPDEKIQEILKQKNIKYLRKTKSGESEVDLRPAIYELEKNNQTLKLILGIGQGGYTRPTEVARLIFEIDEEQAGTLKFHRARMYRHTDDGREIDAIEL